MTPDPDHEAVVPAQASTKRQLGELGSIPAGNLRSGELSWGKSLWHAHDVKRFPRDERLFGRDLRELIRDWIVPGSAPDEPILSGDDSVITMGSCFARELRTYLNEIGFSAGNFWVPSGLNNTFAILDFVSWCVTGQETARGFRYNRIDGDEVLEWKPEAEREEYLAGIREAGAFVFTLGLAEVWQDKETKQVFWRGVPKHLFEADRHEFRVTSVEENEANLLRIVELIRTVNPQAPIVLTLSPVPLLATFRDISCIPADCVSKSVLRVALDRVMDRRLAGVYYWPSFEIVRWAGAHVPWRAYGADDGKPRNVTRYVVSQIIDAFVEAFFRPAAVAQLRARGMTGAEPAPWSMQGRAQAVRLRARERAHSARLTVQRARKSRSVRRARKLVLRAGKRVRTAVAGAQLAGRGTAGQDS